jgi:hypothetical protein
MDLIQNQTGGGLVVSQCLTPYIEPVIYLCMEGFREWIVRKYRPKNAPTERKINLATA